MGADYYTYLYLGLEVTRADFMAAVTETVVLCAHPEAEGTKFCPTCGTKTSKRTTRVTKDVWVSEAIAEVMKAADIENWDDALYDPYDGTQITPDLRLYEIKPSSEDRSGKLILGSKLGKIGGWTNEWLTTLDPKSLAQQQQTIADAAVKLGLTGRPVLHVTHYCSV